METSDSECFESADEDFYSEDEDQKTVLETKPQEKTTYNSNQKQDTILKETVNKLSNVKCKESEAVESEEKDVNKNKKQETTVVPEKVDRVPDNQLANQNVINNKGNFQKESKELDELNVPPCEIKGIDNKEIEPTFICKVTKDVEENLWDDEEIDWGKEAEADITSKEQEENLWEDKDIAWGKEETSANKTECTNKTPVRVPVCNNKQDNLGKDKVPEEANNTLNKSKEKDGKILESKNTNEPEENLWKDDDWEPIHSEPQLKSTESSSSNIDNNTWGSWGTWGVSSILNTATQSVSTLTNQVSHGLSTVLESGMGIPDPEEMAIINNAEKKIQIPTQKSTETDHSGPLGFGIGNFVSGVSHLTKLVESTSTKVISGGLDTLETIGKKTMEVLQEGDPGLKKKRAFLKLDQGKPVLSQVLREAKEKAEEENKILEEKHFSKRMKNYETLFDDHQGLVHLEALEMLSRQCDIRLQSLCDTLSGEAFTEMQETMEQVKELCELPEEDEDEQITYEEIKEKLETSVKEINIKISYGKLISLWDETERWLDNLKLDFCDEKELHQQAIETLAQVTAAAVEQFHKGSELLLVKDHRSTADEADSLVQLTTTLKSLILLVAGKFADKLNAKAVDSSKKQQVNDLITNIFFEAANSSSYIQNAFQLLIPVLQVGAV